jgi:heat shock protein HtpX
MASLYTHKIVNLRKTWLFMGIFLIFVIALGWLFSYVLNSPIILYIAIAFSLIMNVISYWYSDKIVLAITRAKLVKKEENPELHRIVENLAITGGLPKPKIYIIEEKQPNAFATGRNPKHSAIAVTKGLLERLDRSELEGVLAHELAHIGNRDILISTVAVVLAGFIAIISDIFLRSMFFGFYNRNRNTGQLGAFLMIVAIIAAILAPIAALLIRLAISRKREFLADATGALLTRYPEGLARALEKISKNPQPMRIASNATSHLWISSPFKGRQSRNWLAKLFMTHPPVEERVRSLRGMRI